MRRRILHDAVVVGIIFLIGIGYYAFVSGTGFGIPCFLKSISGLDCPTCGSTRMMVALLHGNVAQAFKYNGAMLIVLPIALVDLSIEEIKYIRTGNRLFSKYSFILYGVIIAALIVFFFIRNFG